MFEPLRERRLPMKEKDKKNLSDEERKFLQMIHNPSLRSDLLAHLRVLGLLDVFLQAEIGTN